MELMLIWQHLANKIHAESLVKPRRGQMTSDTANSVESFLPPTSGNDQTG